MFNFIKKLFTPAPKPGTREAVNLREQLQKIVEDYTFRLSENEQEISVLDDTIATMMNHRAELAAKLLEATELLNRVKSV